MASFSYLKPDNLYKHFKSSEKTMSPLFDPLAEYERIARNKPHPNIDKAYPKVTDGTLAAIVQETPKRYIQQLPTGLVKTNLPDGFDIYANWKLTEDIIPKANCQADALQKSWRAGGNSMTYGSAHAYVFMEYYEGEMQANFKLPYITHVYLQKGKISSRESDYLFLESWYQESDIDALIDKEKKLKKDDKDYKGEWDVKALESIKKSREAKQDDQKNPSEREQNENAESDGIRIIHAFQTGIGNKFFSFATETGDENGNEVKVVRTKVNPDPRGVIPIHTLYFNLDLSNPLGRGAIELSGGMQNLLDSHTQAFQYMQALEMNPPIMKWGDMANGAVKYVPNAIIDMGNNPNNKLEAFKINTQAISSFPNTYGLIKSQILNLNNSSDTSVSAESGNPGFSKTQAGVKSIQERLGVSDNYMRKQYETWWGEVCETMLNLTFAETTGVVEEHLDPKTADKLRQAMPEDNEIIQWEDIENSDTIYVDYDRLGEEPIYFEVDASSSEVKQDNEQLEALTAARELVMEMLPVSKRMQFVNKLIYKLGLEDPEDMTFTKEELEGAAEAEQMQEEQARAQAEAQAQGQPSPEEQAMMEQQMMQEQQMQQQQQLAPEEMELAQALQQRGFAPEQIEQAIVLLRQDYPEEQIIQILMGGQ